MNITKSILLIPLAALLLSGCATHQRSEYAAFTEAGAEYAQAIDKILVTAGQVQIDYTSWVLASDKHQSGVGDRTKYDQLTYYDKKILEDLQNLRKHTGLLATYFTQLEALATSNAPERTKDAIEKTVGKMTKLSVTLGASLPTEVPGLSEAGNVLIDLRIRSALEEELETRKKIIHQALQVHEELLTFLTTRISDQITFIKNTKENLLVRSPFIDKSPLTKPEEWVANRHEVVYLPISAEEIRAASKAAKKMREAFKDLLAGKDTIGTINALVIDIKSILAVADAFEL